MPGPNPVPKHYSSACTRPPEASDQRPNRRLGNIMKFAPFFFPPTSLVVASLPPTRRCRGSSPPSRPTFVAKGLIRDNNAMRPKPRQGEHSTHHNHENGKENTKNDAPGTPTATMAITRVTYVDSRFGWEERTKEHQLQQERVKNRLARK